MGIDEAFLDITSRVRDYDKAEELAHRIKEEILEKERLTCSIGIGPSKLVAKIASDYRKPDGLTNVKDEDVEEFLFPLPVRKLLWVGQKTERKLKKIGVKTIGDLANYDPARLMENFGITGTQLHLMAHGIDGSEVQERDRVKSISRELTFEEDTSDPDFICQVLEKLSIAVHKDLTTQGYCFKTVTIKVRHKNFETHSHGKTIPLMTDRLQDLQKMVKELGKDYLVQNVKIRLVGVRVSNLVSVEKQKKLLMGIQRSHEREHQKRCFKFTCITM